MEALQLSPWNSSYKLGYDHRFTNELTYYFTFYSELGERERARWTEAALLGAVLLCSALTNSLLVTVLCRAQQRTVTNTFLASLAAADLLLAAGIPAVLWVRLRPAWPLGGPLCKLLPYSQLTCGFAVLWSLTLISVERYRCLSPDRHRRVNVPLSSANAAVAIIWLVALLLFSPLLFWFNHEPRLQICTLMFPRSSTVKISLLFTVLIVLFTCLLPMAILVFNYHRIYMKMVESRERWCEGCAQTSSLTRQEQLRLDKLRRVMRISILNVSMVLAMWLPITLVLVLIYLDGDRRLGDTSFFLRSHHFLWALCLALFNTAINPLLSGALRLSSASCASPPQPTPSLSRLLRFGSSAN